MKLDDEIEFVTAVITAVWGLLGALAVFVSVICALVWTWKWEFNPTSANFEHAVMWWLVCLAFGVNRSKA